jgi:phage terminase large subunit-like protein
MAQRHSPTKRTTSSDPVTAYAQSVDSGETPAGPQVRAACARHLRDLKRKDLVWDTDAVKRVIDYFRLVLRLNGGQFEGKPFILQPWQAFVVGSIFGWKTKDGFRRFRNAFVLTGKGSGKSPLAAGIGLYMMASDDEPRSEVYAAASKKDQAQVLFRDAVAMVRQSPKLLERFGMAGGNGREWNIDHIASSSFFRPISSDDGQSGPRPHCALLDEIHEHRDNTMVEMLRAGTKFRRQALIFMITNAPADRTGVCSQYMDYAMKVANDNLQDDSFFGYVAGLDKDDDPFMDEDCWAKANPSLGVTFQHKYLREQVTQARGMPGKEALVRRLNFCQPTDANEHFIGSDLWDRAQRDFDDELVRGMPCWLSLDLSSKRDLTSLSACWREESRYYLRNWFWTPKDTLKERERTDNVPYDSWVRQGFLNAEEGRIIDKEHVARFVQQLVQEFDVRALVYDQAQIEDFIKACDNIGFDVWRYEGKDQPEGQGLKLIRHGQGFAGYNSEHTMWMPRSVNDFEECIIKDNLNVKPNPVLTWNAASAVLLSDPSGNRKWDKRKATGRIDGIVSASMAVAAAHQSEMSTGKSFWDLAA